VVREGADDGLHGVLERRPTGVHLDVVVDPDVDTVGIVPGDAGGPVTTL
jgi:hypothetical protein